VFIGSKTQQPLCIGGNIQFAGFLSSVSQGELKNLHRVIGGDKNKQLTFNILNFLDEPGVPNPMNNGKGFIRMHHGFVSS